MPARLDRQTAFSGTRPVTEMLAFDPHALDDYLKSALDDYRGPLTVEQFKGGQSNPTYLLTARSGRYVLRRKPPGKLLPSAHAIEREFRIMSVLASAGYPVPRPRLLCEDDGIVGTAFYVMDFADGRIIWEPHCPDLPPADRSAVYDAMNAALACLHSLDFTALNLGDFGKPSGYMARQIKRWTRQYDVSATETIAEMDRLMAFLPDHVPPESGAAIVHGDFRLDNLIVARDRPDVLAVIDWELATLGDPIADFTYHLMQWVMPPSPDGSGVGSLVGHDLRALGIPALDAYVDSYCRRTGRGGLGDLDYYLAYNFFRMAAIFQGIVGRVRDGTATSENAAALAGQVRPMAETAWRYAKRAGAA